MITLSLGELLPEEKRRLHELELQLNLVERNSSNVHVSDITIGLTEMGRRLDDLEKMIQNEPIKRRDDFKRRLNHLRSSHKNIKLSLDNWISKNTQYDYETQKRRLFGNADLEGGLITESEVAENSSLLHSNKMMNDYISIGQETLSNLFAQKERMKGVQRKMFDIINYLGLSNSIMRAVEKRDYTDKWIVITGMVLITLLIVLLYFYVKPKLH